VAMFLDMTGTILGWTAPPAACCCIAKGLAEAGVGGVPNGCGAAGS
jgi:hypothetical protein